MLQRLGLADALRNKDLAAVRAFYDEFRGDSKGDKHGKKADDFSDMVFKTAGVKNCVMTNVSFSAAEAAQWRPSSKPRSSRYRSGLRVDPLLAGDTEAVMEALRAAGYERTLEGARECLREWVGTMKPENMMASTPKGFEWSADGEEPPAAKNNKGVDENGLKVVGAFAASASLTSSGGGCCDESGEASTSPTLINEASLISCHHRHS